MKKSGCVLVVEDDDMLGSILEKTLISVGYEVRRAHNGKEALKLYDPETVDVVLTDLIMPEKEGIELIHELRRLHPSVKVIAMSGGETIAAGTYLKIAEKLGAAAVLAKPFFAEELLDVLEAV